MRHFVICALLLSLAVPKAAPAQTSDPASLLALHHHYVGWQLGDNTVSSLRAECTETDASGAVAHITEQRMGMAYRDDVHSPAGDSAQGFTGNLFWQSTDGFTTPIISANNGATLALDTVFAEGTTQLSATSAGTAQIDGKTYDVLRTSMANEPMELYVDPTTGAYARVVIDPGGEQEQVVDIDGYSEAAPGIRVISAFHTDGTNERHVCSSVHANAGVQLDALRPPSPSATWTFTSAQPVPIHTSHEHVIVSAQVNGVPGEFVLDTGTKNIVLTDAFAARAHVSESGSGTIHHTRAQSITIGGNTLSNVSVTTVDVDMTEVQTPTEPLQHVDGVFGFDFLAGALVDLNLGNNTIRFRDPNVAQPDPSAGFLLVVDLSNGTPVFPMKIDGSIDAYAMLDSGFVGSVFFARDLIWEHGLKIAYNDTGPGQSQYAVGTATGGGVASMGCYQNSIGGQSYADQFTKGYEESISACSPILSGISGIVADKCGRLDSVALGPIAYQFMQACETHDLHGRDMIVGWDFFKHFNYVFDYPRAVIQIMSNGNTQS